MLVALASCILDKLRKLSDLACGEGGIIDTFTDEEMALKLMEMGCLPGEIIVVEQVAPMGGPMNIRVSGYMLSLRKDEADKILIEPLK